MITLNLLPPKHKIQVKQTSICIAIENLVAITLIFLIIVSISILISKVKLQDNYYGLIARTSLSLSETHKLERDVKEINQKLRTVGEIQDQYTKWSTFMIDLNKIIPDNIQLNLLSINKKERRFALEGIAKTRNDLLAFKKILQNFSYLSNIDLPTSSLLKKNDVNFALTAEINFKP